MAIAFLLGNLCSLVGFVPKTMRRYYTHLYTVYLHSAISDLHCFLLWAIRPKRMHVSVGRLMRRVCRQLWERERESQPDEFQLCSTGNGGRREFILNCSRNKQVVHAFNFNFKSLTFALCEYLLGLILALATTKTEHITRAKNGAERLVQRANVHCDGNGWKGMGRKQWILVCITYLRNEYSLPTANEFAFFVCRQCG